jgi:hypothetical protein
VVSTVSFSQHGALDVDRFLELYKKALFEFMTKKNTNVNGAFFVYVFSSPLFSVLSFCCVLSLSLSHCVWCVYVVFPVSA